ncbi:MAG: short-chain fatty acid transporter, partial [Planctomycetes bacterium]|nr:short-chain fatty acid transporter [Planctomycetota bacterium]
DFTAIQAVDAWGSSYWGLLRFTAQMILILALGHVLANTRPVHRILVALASLIRTAPMAYAGLTTFASLAALISWGLGLIVPAVLSRIVANNCRERGVKVHYPLLVACAYTGSIVSMQGLSASIPLTLNTPDHFLQESIGLIGLDQTIFSAWSLGIVFTIIVVLPQVMRRLAPPED